MPAAGLVYRSLTMELQQIGASHPRIKQVIDLQKNTKPNPQKLFVAEGLWAHNALLEADTEIATFLWCPEAAYSDEANKRSEEVAARAGQSFRVSEKTLARVSERDKPDGLLSVARLPLLGPGSDHAARRRPDHGRGRDRDPRQPRHADPHAWTPWAPTCWS